MKKIVIGVFALAMTVGFATTAQSATYFQNNVDVDFFVVDTSGDGEVELDITNLTGSTVFYSSNNGTSWDSFSSTNETVTFNLTPSGQLLVIWGVGTEAPPADRVGNLEFSGGDGGFYDLYSSVLVDFDEDAGSQLTFDTVVTGDHLKTTVPVASSAVLLGSGLFGLLAFGYRRRSAQE